MTKFWGHPIYIGATILLPAGYDEHPQQYYPVIYKQNHFSLEPPISIRTEPPASDQVVVDYTREHGYDLRAHLEKNWPSIGPLLTGKISMWTGDMDDYYLNLGVYDMEEFFQAHPEAHTHFEYGRPLKGHGWSPWNGNAIEPVRIMARHIKESAPAGTDVRSWYEP